MIWKLLLGIVLLLLAGGIYRAVRTTAVMLRNPLMLVVAMKLGPKRTRPILLVVAAVLAVLGVAMIVYAFF